MPDGLNQHLALLPYQIRKNEQGLATVGIVPSPPVTPPFGQDESLPAKMIKAEAPDQLAPNACSPKVALVYIPLGW